MNPSTGPPSTSGMHEESGITNATTTFAAHDIINSGDPVLDSFAQLLSKKYYSGSLAAKRHVAYSYHLTLRILLSI